MSFVYARRREPLRHIYLRHLPLSRHTIPEYGAIPPLRRHTATIRYAGFSMPLIATRCLSRSDRFHFAAFIILLSSSAGFSLLFYFFHRFAFGFFV